jgi:rhomboid protease GluP
VESRPICPQCRAFISRADRVCPYCDFELVPKASSPFVNSRSLSNLLPQDGQITKYLLASNLFLYLATILFDQQNVPNSRLFDPSGVTLFLFGSKDAQYIFGGQWWRLITAGFLHASLMHIAFNGWGLYQLGGEVEDAIGTARFIWAYLFSTITGFLASSIFSPFVPSVGASAGIFGLLGALIAAASLQGGLMGRYMRSAYLNSAIIALLLTAFTGFTDNWAHLGGIAGGFLFVWLTGKLNLNRPLWNPYWNASALGAIALVLLSFVLQMFTALRMMA